MNLSPPAPSRSEMRLVVAEDSGLIREGIVRLLRDQGFDVVAEVSNADDLLRATQEQQPDIVLTDIRMPPTNTTEGLDAANEIRRRHPHIGVVLLSHHVEARHAVDLLAAGGRVGYLLKDRVSDARELADAIARVGGGEAVIDPDIVQQLLQRPRKAGPLDRLTTRERELLALMAEGRSNAAITQRLMISPKTVEGHVSCIFTKLDLEPAVDDHRRVLAVLAHLRG